MRTHSVITVPVIGTKEKLPTLNPLDLMESEHSTSCRAEFSKRILLASRTVSPFTLRLFSQSQMRNNGLA